MNDRRRTHFCASMVLCLALALSSTTQAAAVVANVFFDIRTGLGDTDIDFTLSLNGVGIPTQNQVIELNPGDTLSAEISAIANSIGSSIGEIFGDLEIQFALDDLAARAIIHSVFDATVDTGGVDAIADGSRNYDCASIFKCAVLDSPGRAESGVTAVSSDTVVGNVKIVNDVAIPTGQTGGTERLVAEDRFELNRIFMGPPTSGNPALFLSAGVDAETFEDGNASAFVTWQVTVVPVPAALWLFGSAVGLLGWLRRRRTA